MYASSKIMLFTKMMCTPANPSQVFSSPEPKAYGELIVYQSSWRLSVRASMPVCVHTFKLLRNRLSICTQKLFTMFFRLFLIATSLLWSFCAICASFSFCGFGEMNFNGSNFFYHYVYIFILFDRYVVQIQMIP